MTASILCFFEELLAECCTGGLSFWFLSCLFCFCKINVNAGRNFKRMISRLKKIKVSEEESKLCLAKASLFLMVASLLIG